MLKLKSLFAFHSDSLMCGVLGKGNMRRCSPPDTRSDSEAIFEEMERSHADSQEQLVDLICDYLDESICCNDSCQVWHDRLCHHSDLDLEI